ncbi:YIP1 family protein [Mammaliicoccus sciuri]|uniref:YIP1 family protein n=1 Tax=Mammaliicoccus sciuri TaxID=1296 RepID=UPI002886A22F|nr:YIP1 family protein [Mammaliicoccus sciuri]MDT0707788.1 YIP1 family protein [Mammaliicoccus sciuri]
MKHSNLLFAPTLNNYRERPKWLLNMILVIILSVASIWITSITNDLTADLKEAGLSETEINQMSTFTTVFAYIGGILAPIIGIAFSFLIFLIISKIMKSDVKASSLFAAATFVKLITIIFNLIVIVIIAIVGLDPVKYSITSLAVFNQSNDYLGVFDLSTLLTAYLFGVVLYATSRFKGKTAIIWTVIYFVVVIGIGLIQASI